MVRVKVGDERLAVFWLPGVYNLFRGVYAQPARRGGKDECREFGCGDGCFICRCIFRMRGGEGPARWVGRK